jgi:NAD(P)-dependent dehydrogenase (short-subunit alcohol dehydrogenase family)
MMAEAHKTAIVTGGASGIGRATVLEFMRRGYRVALWDRDEAEAAAVVDELPAARAVTVDVADPVSVQKAVATTLGIFEHIDVLVAAAAVGGYAPLLDVADDEWRRIMSVDIDGVFWCLRECARRMPSGSSVVLIASDRGLQPEPGWTPYCVAKSAVIQLGRAAALELAPAIRVNVVSPGPTDTPLLAQNRLLPGVYERIANAPPLGRLAEPAEIAAAVVFVAEHPFMTGSILTVDGGMALAGTFGVRGIVEDTYPPSARPEAPE